MKIKKENLAKYSLWMAALTYIVPLTLVAILFMISFTNSGIGHKLNNAGFEGNIFLFITVLGVALVFGVAAFLLGFISVVFDNQNRVKASVAMLVGFVPIVLFIAKFFLGVF